MNTYIKQLEKIPVQGIAEVYICTKLRYGFKIRREVLHPYGRILNFLVKYDFRCNDLQVTRSYSALLRVELIHRVYKKSGEKCRK